MTILTTIKAASLQVRKDRNAPKAALLSTLMSDIQMVGKNDGDRETTEAEAVAIIKKYIVNTKETLDTLLIGNISEVGDKLEKYHNEIQWLNEFLPKQFTEEEIQFAIITALVEIPNPTIKDLGKVMKYLKENYGGQYDGQLASKLAKEKLSVGV